jgi:hypothetical protein
LSVRVSSVEPAPVRSILEVIDSPFALIVVAV